MLVGPSVCTLGVLSLGDSLWPGGGYGGDLGDGALADRHPRSIHLRGWNRARREACRNLRDTFASQLLTAGIPLKYISKQLGHASTGVTEAHYARYIAEEYREPMRLTQGEVPADLLARLSAAKEGAQSAGRAK